MNLGKHTRRCLYAPIQQVKWRSICIFFFTSILKLYRITPIFVLLHVRLEAERDELPRLLRFDRSLFNKASRFWKHLNGLTCRYYKEQRSKWFQCYNSSTSYVISKICFTVEKNWNWQVTTIIFQHNQYKIQQLTKFHTILNKHVLICKQKYFDQGVEGVCERNNNLPTSFLTNCIVDGLQSCYYLPERWPLCWILIPALFNQPVSRYY